MSDRWERETYWWPFGRGNHPCRSVTEYGHLDENDLFVPEEAYFEVSEDPASRRQISLTEATRYKREEAFRTREGGGHTRKIQ